MKILALTGTKRKGNSILAAKYIAKKLNAELDILNVTELKIEPCKACYACLFGQECMIDDDVNFVFSKLLEADFVLISSAIYWLDATGMMKALLDRMFMALPHMKELSRKKGAVIYFYGFEELRGWGANTYNILLRVLGIEPLAILPIHAALPGEALTEENVKKLDLLAEAIRKEERLKLDGQCPVCLSEVFRAKEGKLECTVCRSKLTDDLQVVETGDVLSYDWMVKHYGVLRGFKEKFIEQREVLARLREKYGV
ncbi:NAD(P)H-dependent oxidoreductase [Geoglobus acetivorans]|uniref:Flavodoxin family protein n=1 Tax=Geoglobus acetivorans TaxID=565033 RepID=A0ABZ3H787_GEOAI|nr:flavodoxin family protein [Geoglobus acetivorans]